MWMAACQEVCIPCTHCSPSLLFESLIIILFVCCFDVDGGMSGGLHTMHPLLFISVV